MSISKTDKFARERCITILREKFSEIVKNIIEGKRPVIIMPKRILTNTIYDEKNKLLLLGPEMQRRSFLDVNESKKFMQTLLMASIIYEALINNEYPTIRDLYYRGKHTITYRDLHGRLHHENTWDEQRESDSVIRDLEVYLGLLREELLILSKEKGKVVGNLVIKSGDDVIDLSKMGHGAYSIEPTPDLIEFKDVDAEYVLVVEKDAVFQQLHRYGFWKKYKAILITSAGQPDRATRRFVRRLNEELKLPVYILTDSIPADEVVVIKDLESNEIKIGPVEELIGKYFEKGKIRERVIAPIAVASWDPSSGKIEWRPVGYMYRHWIKDKILRIKIKGRGIVRVTKAHSLFVFRNGKIVVEPAYRIKPGDYIVVAEKIPIFNDDNDKYHVINVAKLLLSNKELYSSRFKLENSLWLGIKDGKEIRLAEASTIDIDKASYVRLSRSRKKVNNKVVVDEELAWVLGLYTAEGSAFNNRYIVFNLGPHEKEKAQRLASIIERKFGLKPIVKRDKGIKVIIMSRIMYLVFKSLGILGKARTKRVPGIIINSPKKVILSYLKGLFEGDGNIDRYGDIIYSTRSKVLSKQVFLILQALGVNPSLTINSEDLRVRIGKSYSRTPSSIYAFFTKKNSIKSLTSEPTYGLPIEKEVKRKLIRLMNQGLTSYSSKNTTISKTKLALLTSQKLLQIPRDHDLTVTGNIVLAKVVSVEEEEYEGYVYDFAVPYTNSFIGGYGVIYHNSDPYGWYIYSVFKIGSITLSYESERLATPNAKFIGVAMTDVFGDSIVRKILRKSKKLGDKPVDEILKLPHKKPYLTEQERKNYIIKAKPKDVERAVELIGYDVAEACLEDRSIRSMIRKKKEGIAGYPWFKTPEWIRELCIFFKTLSKLEIEAMASKGLKFLADKYIPEKIETGDYID